MNQIEIPIINTSYNSPIVEAYINQSDFLKPFYPSGFDVNGIIASAKNKDFESNKRSVLVEVLKEQYKQADIDLTDNLVGKNIAALNSKNTFTITAGQQIHAYLGPMFVAYKLLSAVALAAACVTKNPDNNYVPVFWMATEDHDFEEISEINLFGETFNWQKPSATNDAVGNLSTHGLVALGDQILEKLKNDKETFTIIEKMQSIYAKIPNFADATRKILHHFFESTGIIVLDANDARLKAVFSPILEKEISNPQPESINKYTHFLEANGIKKQIGARESNLFLFHKGNRERLAMIDNQYQTADSQTDFTKNQLLNLVKTNPEMFSPNVALRPLYQEYILPNLAYISGGSEMIYWYQIKGLFEYYNIDYPNVWLRKSGMILSNKIADSITKTGLQIADMFKGEDDLTTLISESLNESNAELFNPIATIQNELDSLEFSYRKSNIFNKITLDAIKTIIQEFNQLNKKMEGDQLDLLNESPIFSKLLKIQENNFKIKQERTHPLFTQLKNLRLINNKSIYKSYIINTNLLVFLA